MNTNGTKKRTFDEQFKRDAVALANAGGSSAVAAAVEIAALRRELDSIRAQNDILKKALAIVAQQEASATPSSKPSTTSSRA